MVTGQLVLEVVCMYTCVCDIGVCVVTKCLTGLSRLLVTQEDNYLVLVGGLAVVKLRRVSCHRAQNSLIKSEFDKFVE